MPITIARLRELSYVGYRAFEPVTDRQLILLNALLKQSVKSDRALRLELLSNLFGRPMSSSKELVKGEANALISLLKSRDGYDLTEEGRKFLEECV